MNENLVTDSRDGLNGIRIYSCQYLPPITMKHNDETYIQLSTPESYDTMEKQVNESNNIARCYYWD
jgi:hypothetical protein